MTLIVYLLFAQPCSITPQRPRSSLYYLFDLLVYVARVYCFPVLFILIHRNRWKFRRSRDRAQTLAMLLKLTQPLGCQSIRLVDTVYLDAMTAVSDMKTPVPGVTDLYRLCVQTVIPAAGEDLDPAFGDDRELHVPCAPGVLVFLGHVLYGYRVPGMAAVGRTLDSFYSGRVSKLIAGDCC